MNERYRLTLADEQGIVLDSWIISNDESCDYASFPWPIRKMASVLLAQYVSMTIAADQKRKALAANEGAN